MGFIMVVHIIVCVLLVICVLMQAGRGGGLAESFSSAESMFGTQTNQFMVRLTTIFAIIFLSTSLILAVNSSKKDKSLMSNTKLLPKQTATTAEPKVEEPTVKVEDPKPMADVLNTAASPIETKVKKVVAEASDSVTKPLVNSIK